MRAAALAFALISCLSGIARAEEELIGKYIDFQFSSLMEAYFYPGYTPQTFELRNLTDVPLQGSLSIYPNASDATPGSPFVKRTFTLEAAETKQVIIPIPASAELRRGGKHWVLRLDGLGQQAIPRSHYRKITYASFSASRPCLNTLLKNESKRLSALEERRGKPIGPRRKHLPHLHDFEVFPRTWLTMLPLPLLVLHEDDVEALGPETLDAMRDYLHFGGKVWLMAPTRPEELLRALGGPPSIPAQTVFPVGLGWIMHSDDVECDSVEIFNDGDTSMDLNTSFIPGHTETFLEFLFATQMENRRYGGIKIHNNDILRLIARLDEYREENAPFKPINTTMGILGGSLIALIIGAYLFLHMRYLRSENPLKALEAVPALLIFSGIVSALSIAIGLFLGTLSKGHELRTLSVIDSRSERAYTHGLLEFKAPFGFPGGITLPLDTEVHRPDENPLEEFGPPAIKSRQLTFTDTTQNWSFQCQPGMRNEVMLRQVTQPVGALAVRAAEGRLTVSHTVPGPMLWAVAQFGEQLYRFEGPAPAGEEAILTLDESPFTGNGLFNDLTLSFVVAAFEEGPEVRTGNQFGPMLDAEHLIYANLKPLEARP